MRLSGATDFPCRAMALWCGWRQRTLLAEFGHISAQESRAIGIQWNWFPVADVNSNPANPIINTRSFGADPALVGAMLSASIDGARSAGGMLTHRQLFPATATPIRILIWVMARTTASVDRLNTFELVPFRAAIARQARTVQ